MQDNTDVEMEVEDVAEAGALEREFERWRDEVGREDELFMAAEEESRKMEVEKRAESVAIAGLSSAEAKERGNRYFSAGNFKEAMKWYDIAANEAEDEVEKATVMCNRALVKHKLQDAAGAAADAALALSVKGIPDKIKLKAQKRKADAEKVLQSKSAAELRKQGNDAYKVRDFRQALQMYNMSVSQAQDAAERALGLSNRCAAHLALRHLREAEEDAYKVLEIGAPETIIPKTARRLVASLSGQGRSREAAQKIHSLLDRTASESSIRPELEQLMGTLGEKPARKAVQPASQQVEVQRKFITSAPDSAPKSYYEFEKTWRNLKHHPEERIRYLKLLPTDLLPALFGECLSSQLVEDVVGLLSATKERDGDDMRWALNVLLALSRTRRFEMLQMLFDDSLRDAVDEILDEAQGRLGTANDLADKIASIRKAYT
mmetsp:Transcript_5505/g.16417  ORF Transcript_5505/g.16417 Transcript_5505/m.16417 type:complete len:433 (-) Transcript_5505:1053-2351(-)